MDTLAVEYRVDCKRPVCVVDWDWLETVFGWVVVARREGVDECVDPYTEYRELAVPANHDDDDTVWPCAVAAVPVPCAPFVGTPVVPDKAPEMEGATELAPITAVPLPRPPASAMLDLAHDVASFAL